MRSASRHHHHRRAAGLAVVAVIIGAFSVHTLGSPSHAVNLPITSQRLTIYVVGNPP